MKAEDTVMNEAEIVKEASKDSTYCQLSVDIGNWAAKKQAEISFKAGIKEVIEWIENNAHYSVVKDGYTLDETDWQFKLKEWLCQE